MNKYTVLKWEKLLLWLIPPILRKKTHVDWLNVLLTPLRTIYEETLYKMQHTGQVIYLEKVLNETYNPTKNYNPNLSIEEKRLEELIYIDESVKPTIQYVYLHKEYYEPDGTLMIPQLKVYTHDEYKKRNNKPVYLAHRKDYTQINYANFRVFIPESLIANNTITVQPAKDQSVQTDAINVANMEYHNLLNFYKLAGKSYGTYSYSVKD
ncbi:hypothetical protein OA93_20800 [Flavobacterium sp. KMS]|uniref:hypothetical protein n=1 Tax=Flavobacterium sp. KMS TaxID=1566023 RepID=UPI000580A33F|nr:hypothetical protein [Flavobacterium sp. KMS]KIA93903.1 hypothetical protein OA93_20800 [Flavobacterium sp. KMS]KIC03732.1 hypothetical protein OA88_02095 [Flavobacterium sp. JRM]